MSAPEALPENVSEGPTLQPAPALLDAYEDDRAPGAAIGSAGRSGAARLGADAEGVIGIDGGALRIGCMRDPGWGRHAVAYGPQERREGLALAIAFLNGHHGSKTAGLGAHPGRERLRRVLWRLRRLARIAAERLARALGRPPGDAERAPNHYRWPSLDESLALGWFAESPPPRTRLPESGFLIRAAGAENGELCVRIGARWAAVAPGIQNVPLHCIVVLRERGAAYYLSAAPGVRGAAAYPRMRPLAIDRGATGPRLYAGLHQCILGEIGFRVDTRVYATQIASPPELAGWCGSAHAADRLLGRGPLGNAEVGGPWRAARGALVRTRAGALPQSDAALALLEPEAPTGLLHGVLALRGAAGEAGLVWRARDDAELAAVLVARDGVRLRVLRDGAWRELERWPARVSDADVALQIDDGGEQVRVWLDAELVGAAPASELPEGRGVGLCALGGADARFQCFEAHPREVEIPPALRLGAPWLPAAGRVVARDAFEEAAPDLAGRRTTEGDRAWRREIGEGVIELPGDGTARVRASAARPNPGRTAYTIEWPEPDFADVEVEIRPPGVAKGGGELCRAGLVFWQDADHHVLVNTWNDDRPEFEGASISSFFVLGGREDLRRAVWTNVGRRVRRGAAHRMRVTFDGLRYVVRLDGEPVLYRSLQDVYPGAAPLHVTRVGLAVNWEWGDDTGSVFRDFVARGSSR